MSYFDPLNYFFQKGERNLKGPGHEYKLSYNKMYKMVMIKSTIGHRHLNRPSIKNYHQLKNWDENAKNWVENAKTWDENAKNWDENAKI